MVRDCLSDQWRSNGSIGQNRVQLVGHNDRHLFQELDGGSPGRLIIEPRHGKFRRAINGYEQVEPIAGKTVPRTVFWPGSYFTAAHLGDVDVEVADGIGFELLLGRQIAIDVGQAGYPVPLQAAV